jgi:hypothetical protein
MGEWGQSIGNLSNIVFTDSCKSGFDLKKYHNFLLYINVHEVSTHSVILSRTNVITTLTTVISTRTRVISTHIV